MPKRLTKGELRAERDACLAEIKAGFTESKHPEVHESNEAYYAYVEAEYALALAPPLRKVMALYHLSECGMRHILAKQALEALNARLSARIYELEKANAELDVKLAKLKGALPAELDRLEADNRAKLTLN
jgi:hypothetical protein